MMCIYGLLLIYILTSGASLGSLLPASIMIMAIQSWGGLWTFAEFIDANLFAAMYPNPSASAICGAGRSGMEFGTKRLVLDMLTTSLFVILPLVLTWMLAMAGMKSANLVDSIFTSSTTASRSLGGKTGESGTGNAANKSKRAVKSGISRF